MDFNKEARGRDNYWDFVKALLIFLVILGHVVQFFQCKWKGYWEDPLFKAIYLFHMPLFILISGYFAAKSVAKHSWRSIGRYARRLIFPCIGMGGLFLLVAFVKGKSLLPAIKGFTLLWFLIVVFECVICYCIMHLKSDWWYKVITLILPVLAAITVNCEFGLDFLRPCAGQFTYLWPIFVLGALLSRMGFTHHHINWKWSGFLVLYIIGFMLFKPGWYVYVNPLINFEIDSFLINLVRTGFAIAGCGAMLWICSYLYRGVQKYKFIQKIGQATLAIYVLQTLFFCVNISPLLPEFMGYVDSLFVSITILSSLYVIYVFSRRVSPIAIILYGELPKSDSSPVKAQK